MPTKEDRVREYNKRYRAKLKSDPVRLELARQKTAAHYQAKGKQRQSERERRLRRAHMERLGCADKRDYTSLSVLRKILPELGFKLRGDETVGQLRERYLALDDYHRLVDYRIMEPLDARVLQGRGTYELAEEYGMTQPSVVLATAKAVRALRILVNLPIYLPDVWGHLKPYKMAMGHLDVLCWVSYLRWNCQTEVGRRNLLSNQTVRYSLLRGMKKLKALGAPTNLLVTLETLFHAHNAIVLIKHPRGKRCN